MIPIRPELWPWVGLALLAAAAGMTGQWRRLVRVARAFGPRAADRLLPAGARFPSARAGMLVLGVSVLGVAAVGLEPESPPPPVPPTPLDLAIAVDLSLSMGARDVSPSRLARAREVVAELTERLPGARIALVVFGDWSYTLVPPSDDPAVVRFFAAALEPDALVERDRGTALADALEHAREALDERPREGARRAIVLVSDGAGAAGDTEAEAARASRDGVRVFTAGLGSADGSALEGPSGAILDERGARVTAPLDRALLEAIARAGGGSFHDVGTPVGFDGLSRALREGVDEPGTASDPQRDPGPALMFVGLLLLLAEGAADGGWLPLARGRRRDR